MRSLTGVSMPWRTWKRRIPLRAVITSRPWVHEADSGMQCDLGRLGYTLDTTTRAMGMAVDDLRLPKPELDLRPLEWSAYLRIFDLPPGLLAGSNRAGLQV